MSEKEKSIVTALTDALAELPDSKKEFLLGYAEGVAAMAGKKDKSKADEDRAG